MTVEIDLSTETGWREVWNSVDKLREAESLSLEEIASRCGLTRFAIYKRRERKTGMERLCEVAAMFNAIGYRPILKLERIVGGDTKPQTEGEGI